MYGKETLIIGTASPVSIASLTMQVPLKHDYRKLFELDREDFEKNIKFTGFLIMENKLKPITKTIID